MDTPDSDQLELALGEEFLVGAASLPWSGRSPRALTRGYKRFILKRKRQKRMVEFENPDQYDLWLPIEEGPPVYRGAPLLLPLKEV